MRRLVLLLVVITWTIVPLQILICSRNCVPSVQAGVHVSQAYNLEMSSLKNEISVLQDSIARLEYELSKVSIRKETLGRDSGGRPYWLFFRLDTCSQLVVNRSMTAQGSKVKELGYPSENYSSSQSSVSYGVEDPPRSRGLDASSLYEYEHNVGSPLCIWISYQSDAEIEALTGWLRDSDAKERELKESILNWQRNKSEASDIRRGRKGKVIYEGRTSRCECLKH